MDGVSRGRGPSPGMRAASAGCRYSCFTGETRTSSESKTHPRVPGVGRFRSRRSFHRDRAPARPPVLAPGAHPGRVRRERAAGDRVVDLDGVSAPSHPAPDSRNRLPSMPCGVSNRAHARLVHEHPKHCSPCSLLLAGFLALGRLRCSTAGDRLRLPVAVHTPGIHVFRKGIRTPFEVLFPSKTTTVTIN